MTDYFVRPSAGNDASDGLTFATARKTILTGASAALLVAGDRVKIEKSPDPTDMGQTATWTDLSDTVTLTTAVTKTVTSCDSVWTADNGQAATTETGIRRQGTNSAKITVDSTTTGLVAHFALGSTQDFSSYMQLTFSIYVGTTIAASNVVRVALCSDVAGATPVDTFDVPHRLQSGSWFPITVDKGSALGSSIQSVALYIQSALGGTTTAIYLDNLEACKDSTSADSLNLNSLIGKNDGRWYAIRSILGTTIKLDSSPVNSIGTTAEGYSGTTGSAEIWKRESWPLAYNGTDPQLKINDTGTSSASITYSGGWDPADNMVTQNGETWWDLLSGAGDGYRGTSLGNATWINIEKQGVVRSGYSFRPDEGWVMTDVSSVACAAGDYQAFGAVTKNAPLLSGDCYAIQSSGSAGAVIASSGMIAIENLDVVSRNASSNIANNGSSSRLTISGTLKVENCSGIGVTGGGIKAYAIQAKNNAGAGVSITGNVDPVDIGSLTATGNVGYGLIFSGKYGEIRSLTTSGNTTGAVSIPAGQHGKLILHNASMAEATKISTTGIQDFADYRVQSHREGGVATTHKVYTDGASVVTDTGSDRHTLSGIAWKIGITKTTRGTYYPFKFDLPSRVVTSGADVTVSVWVKRSVAASIGARLVVPANCIGGVTSDQIVEMTAGNDTYEQISLTFTPSETAPFKAYLEVYTKLTTGTPAEFVWIDDYSCTEA